MSILVNVRKYISVLKRKLKEFEQFEQLQLTLQQDFILNTHRSAITTSYSLFHFLFHEAYLWPFTAASPSHAATFTTFLAVGWLIRGLHAVSLSLSFGLERKKKYSHLQIEWDELIL